MNAEPLAARAAAAAPAPRRLVRIDDVAALTQLSKSMIRLLDKSDPEFPRHIQLTKRAIAWDEQEVLAWIEHRARQRAKLS